MIAMGVIIQRYAPVHELNFFFISLTIRQSYPSLLLGFITHLISIRILYYFLPSLFTRFISPALPYSCCFFYSDQLLFPLSLFPSVINADLHYSYLLHYSYVIKRFLLRMHGQCNGYRYGMRNRQRRVQIQVSCIPLRANTFRECMNQCPLIIYSLNSRFI